VAVTYLAPPTDRRTLVAFYQRVRPAGPGWAAVRREANLPPSPDSVPQMLLGWTLGCAFVYAALFGAGSFLYGRMGQGLVWLAILLVSGVGLARLLPRLWAGAKPTLG
jgi:SSS family solute:Na+ symporter